MWFLLLPACLINRDVYERRKEELTDHDGDGYVQLDDCDDTKPEIYPDAPEVCDEADQDCDGDVDEEATDAVDWYSDADGDGHGVATAPLSACRDPGAAWVDVPDDCDDTNASAFPGAMETPYDGVDQDCNGADQDDLDGDGWTSELSGGSDCDDSDAETNPDAFETWANGVTDNDCDGTIEPIQLDYGAASWSGWRSGDGLGRRVGSLGDIDGDGLADIILGTEFDSTLGAYSGALYRLDGSPGSPLQASLMPDAAGEGFGVGLDAGRDVNDDGAGDIVVTSVGTASAPGQASLVDGASWTRSADVGEIALGQVSAAAAGTYGPAAARFVGDVNGDGVEDIALGECCWSGGAPGTVGRVAIFSSDAFAGTLDDADVVVDGPWENAYFGYSVDRLGDQDGDGLPEVLINSGGGIVASVVPGNASGGLLDRALTVIYGDPLGTLVRNTGDLDGDGRDDVAIVQEEDYVLFFTALNTAPTRGLQTPTFTFSWTEHGGVSDVLPLGDLDADGRSDVLIPQAWSDSGTQRLWIMMGSETSAGADLSSDDSTLRGVSSVPTALFGYAVTRAGDVDGDGQDDIVLGAPDYSGGTEGAGGATLITVPR